MKAVAVLLPILGTSWIFGVLAVDRQAVVFQYMFAVLNSSQVEWAWGVAHVGFSAHAWEFTAQGFQRPCLVLGKPHGACE